jgi:hypothetical protein
MNKLQLYLLQWYRLEILVRVQAEASDSRRHHIKREEGEGQNNTGRQRKKGREGQI